MLDRLCILTVCACLAYPAAAQDNTWQARAVLKAVDRTILSSELAGKVEKLPLRVGDAFEKDDLLVGLGCELYRAQAEKVRAEHRAAAFEFENVQQLNELGSIGELDVSMAQTQRAQSEAALRIAKLNTQRCEIQAPYSGRVVSLQVARHESVRESQELIEIIDDQRLEAEIVVPASWLNGLGIGKPLTLHFEDVGISVAAEISGITPAIDTISQTLLLRAQVTGDTSSLLPGMSALAEFATNSSS